MPLWLAGAAAGARIEERDPAHDARGRRHSGRGRSRRYRRAGGRAGRRHRRTRARSPRCSRAKRHKRSPRTCRAAWCSAPTRPWRWASGGSRSPPTGRRRATSSGACAGERTSCTPRSRWSRDGAVVFEHREVARLTMRAFSDDFLDSYLDAVGRRRHRERRRLSTGESRRPAVRAHRRRPLHRFSGCRCWRCWRICGEKDCWRREGPRHEDYEAACSSSASPARSEWENRPPRASSPKQGVPVHDADAVVHRLYEGEAVAAIEAAFPGTTVAGKVDRNQLAARVLGDAAALRGSRRSSIRWCRRPSGGCWRRRRRAARRSPCWTFRCCSRPAATGGWTRSWWSRRRRRCSGRGCWSARA